VVNAETGEPTGYSDADKDPNLHQTREVITDGDELSRCMGRKRKPHRRR